MRVTAVGAAAGAVTARDASLSAVVADRGALIPASRRVGIRADIRLHLPRGDRTAAGDSGDARLELALGLSGRL